MAFESIEVSSSAITYLAYDAEAREAQITFKDGRSYILKGIDEIEVNRMANAASPGAYFNFYVRGNY